MALSSTSPICESTRARAGGAWTSAASGVAPPGSLGAGSNGGSSRQCRAASRVGGGGQLLAQRGTERGFQPGGNAQRIDHRRPALAVLHRQHFGQGMRLGRQLGVRRVGGGLPLARGGQRRTGRGAGLLRGGKAVACRCQSGFGGRLFRAGGLERRGIDGLRR